MSNQVKSRREREEESRRNHILEEAEKLFCEKGLHETSVSDIAKGSEFGIGTLYKYFKDKNTLIQSLVATRMNGHFDALHEVIERNDSPVQIVSDLIKVYLNSVKVRHNFFKMYFTNFHPSMKNPNGKKSDGCPLGERREILIERMNKVFQKGIDDGCFADVGAEYLTASLFGILMSFVFLAERKLAGQIEVETMSLTIEKIFFEPVQKKV